MPQDAQKYRYTIAIGSGSLSPLLHEFSACGDPRVSGDQIEFDREDGEAVAKFEAARVFGWNRYVEPGTSWD